MTENSRLYGTSVSCGETDVVCLGTPDFFLFLSHMGTHAFPKGGQAAERSAKPG